MLKDIEIAQQAKMKKIGEIAANLGIEEDEVEQYGHYKAKLNQNLFNRLADKPDDGAGTAVCPLVWLHDLEQGARHRAHHVLPDRDDRV